MNLRNTFNLGVKELRGLWRDPVMLVLIVYSFSLSIWTSANASPEALTNAAISIVDVVEALEGPISITPCERGDDCQQLQMCSVRDPLLKIKAKVVRVLGDTSIYELAMN